MQRARSRFKTLAYVRAGLAPESGLSNSEEAPPNRLSVREPQGRGECREPSSRSTRVGFPAGRLSGRRDTRRSVCSAVAALPSALRALVMERSGSPLRRLPGGRRHRSPPGTHFQGSSSRYVSGSGCFRPSGPSFFTPRSGTSPKEQPWSQGHLGRTIPLLNQLHISRPHRTRLAQ